MFNTTIELELDKQWKSLDTRNADVAKIMCIYLKLQQSEQFAYKVRKQLNHKITVNENVSLRNQNAKTCQMIFDYESTKCECGEQLALVWQRSKHKPSRKGRISIAYSTTKPPQICNSFLQKCGKCKIVYSYGHKFNTRTEDLYRLPMKNKQYFEVTNETYLSVELLDDMRQHVIGQQQSISSYIEAFNNRHRDYKENIYSQWSDLFGHRNSLDLNVKRVITAFYLYHLQIYVETKLNKRLSISKDDRLCIDKENKKINAYIKQCKKHSLETECKQNLNHIKRSNDKHNYMTLPSMSSIEEFNFLYRKYETELNKYGIPGLDKVPVKVTSDGVKIHPGHFKMYGDGNEKCIRWICALPRNIMKYLQKIKLCNVSIDKENIDRHMDGLITIDESQHDIANKKVNDIIYAEHQNRFQCDQTPQHGNGTYKGFCICPYHVHIIVNFFNIDKHDVNVFITYCKNMEDIAKMDEKSKTKKYRESEALQVMIKKKMSICESRILKIERAKRERWSVVWDFIIKYVNVSIGKSTECRNKNKSKANINESSEYLKDTELLENLDNICGESIDTELLEHCNSQSRDDFLDGIEMTELIENVKGCRKKEYIKCAASKQTKGLNALFTCSGFCISLREEVYIESQTKVILDIPSVLTSSDVAIEYFNRIEAIGYDFMCKLWYSLKNYFRYEKLPDSVNKVWLSLLSRLFIDRFHITTHKDKACQEKGGTGFLHPSLPKFKNIFNDKMFQDDRIRINDQICEQFWRHFNKFKSMKTLSQEKYKLYLYMKREHHNMKNIEKLEKEGYIFVDIKEISKLRDYHTDHMLLPHQKVNCKNNDECDKKQIYKKVQDQLANESTQKLNGVRYESTNRISQNKSKIKEYIINTVINKNHISCPSRGYLQFIIKQNEDRTIETNKKSKKQINKRKRKGFFDKDKNMNCKRQKM